MKSHESADVVSGRRPGGMKIAMGEIATDGSSYYINDLVGMVTLGSQQEVSVVIQDAYVGFASVDPIQGPFGLYIYVASTTPDVDTHLDGNVYFKRLDKMESIMCDLDCPTVSDLVGKTLFAHYNDGRPEVFALTIESKTPVKSKKDFPRERIGDDIYGR